MTFKLGPSSKAYQILVAELGQHLETVGRVLTGIDPWTEDDCRRLSATFHTIKGGVGFFGLEELRQLAAKLEELFSAGSLSGAEVEEALELFQSFRRAAGKIPSPQAGEQN